LNWKQIPASAYIDRALSLTPSEEARLLTALHQLPSTIIDCHTHVARESDIDDLSNSLLRHAASTFPAYTLAMAESAKSILWPGKSVRSGRMAHANDGYRHDRINDYLTSELDSRDFLIGFGDSNKPNQVIELLQKRRVAALKMYFNSVTPPLNTILEIFPEQVLRSAEKRQIPIVLHLPTPIPQGLDELINVIKLVPELRIILAHLGGHGGQFFEPDITEAFKVLEQFPNVYMDTAFVWDSALIRAAVQSVGSKRILFGTDEPLSLIRGASYLHQTLGARLFAPTYHWAHDEGVPDEVKLREPVLLHILMIEAVIDAVEADPLALIQIFHDNALGVFREST
jgi:hypothetical protein